jgi:hypothetical protein
MTYPDFDLATLLDLVGTNLDLTEYICDNPTCVDGCIPADQFANIANLYQPCPFCDPAGCGDCGGQAAFPAEPGYLEYLIEQLLAAGLRATLCPGCGGLLNLTELAFEVTS